MPPVTFLHLVVLFPFKGQVRDQQKVSQDGADPAGPRDGGLHQVHNQICRVSHKTCPIIGSNKP